MKVRRSMPTHRLANRLRIARAERGWSQDDLARRAGVTRQTVSSIETGQYVPSALLAFVLAERLGMPVDELFFLEDGAAGGAANVDGGDQAGHRAGDHER